MSLEKQILEFLSGILLTFGRFVFYLALFREFNTDLSWIQGIPIIIGGLFTIFFGGLIRTVLKKIKDN